MSFAGKGAFGFFNERSSVFINLSNMLILNLHDFLEIKNVLYIAESFVGIIFVTAVVIILYVYKVIGLAKHGRFKKAVTSLMRKKIDRTFLLG